MTTLTIAIVDDHALFLGGVAELLKSKLPRAKVTTYQSGLTLLQDLDGGKAFDVVITDLAMKDINGLGLIRAIRNRNFSMPVIVLSASEDAVSRANADAASAFMFLHKSADETSLVEAIEAAANSRSNAKQPDGSVFLTSTARHGIEIKLKEPKLSPRQQRILGLIATGARNADIAEELCISENTVKSHVKAIFRELDVKTRTAAAQRGRELAMY